MLAEFFIGLGVVLQGGSGICFYIAELFESFGEPSFRALFCFIGVLWLVTTIIARLLGFSHALHHWALWE